jgi:hypothetical protein
VLDASRFDVFLTASDGEGQFFGDRLGVHIDQAFQGPSIAPGSRRLPDGGEIDIAEVAFPDMVGHALLEGLDVVTLLDEQFGSAYRPMTGKNPLDTRKPGLDDFKLVEPFPAAVFRQPRVALCQTARKRDPLWAPKRDPFFTVFERRGA